MVQNKKDVLLWCRQSKTCLTMISFFPCAGACVCGHDDSPGDHPSANAADSPAASVVSAAASSTSPATASSYVAAGNVCYLLWTVSIGHSHKCHMSLICNISLLFTPKRMKINMKLLSLQIYFFLITEV